MSPRSLALKDKPMSKPTAQIAQRTEQELLRFAAERAQRYMESIGERRVAPGSKELEGLARFHEPLPESSSDPHKVLRMLDEVGSPATVATTGGRYFGF